MKKKEINETFESKIEEKLKTFWTLNWIKCFTTRDSKQRENIRGKGRKGGRRKGGEKEKYENKKWHYLRYFYIRKCVR